MGGDDVIQGWELQTSINHWIKRRESYGNTMWLSMAKCVPWNVTWTSPMEDEVINSVTTKVDRLKRMLVID